MIIVAGHIITKSGCREDFVNASRKAMIAARNAPGCRDFVVVADPLETDRVYVYEAWDDETSLTDFRGGGPDGGLMDLIERADVSTFSASSND